MTVHTKTIGRMPTDHGPYDPQLAYGKKFIVTLFDCGWESKHENNTSAPATLNAQAGTITENTTDWKKKWGSYKQWLIDNGYQKMDASNVKDGNKTQNTINSETNTRLQSLESSVGSGGSVDLRIAAAKSEIKGNATSACDTLGEAEGLINGLGGRVSTNETDISNLQQLYNNLQQSKPVPVTALPSTGQQLDVIYRVAGSTSYSDYMWNGSTWVLMATYNNAIDGVPTSGSDNLVKSGGVNNAINQVVQGQMYKFYILDYIIDKDNGKYREGKGIYIKVNANEAARIESSSRFQYALLLNINNMAVGNNASFDTEYSSSVVDRTSGGVEPFSVKNNGYLYIRESDLSLPSVIKVNKIDYLDNIVENLKLIYGQINNLSSDVSELLSDIESNTSHISELENCFSNDEVIANVPITFIEGYWNGGTEPASADGWYAVENLILLKPLEKIRLFNWTFLTSDPTSAAAYLYKEDSTPIPPRINLEDFTYIYGYYEYTNSKNENVYIGVDHRGTPASNASIKKVSYKKVIKENNIPDTIATKDYVDNHEDSGAVDIIMFMGQSNMAGRGEVVNAPTIIAGAGYEYRAISDPTKLNTIQEPFGYAENVIGAINDGTSKTGSLVTAFVNSYYTKTRHKVIAVSASEGANSIDDWQPDTPRLDDAIDRLSKAVAYCNNNNIPIRHKYMAWCQGETDGDYARTAQYYQTKFAAMFAEMQDNGIEACFLIRIGLSINPNRVPEYTVIGNAQTDMCKTKKDVVLVSTELAADANSTCMKDDFHFYQFVYNSVGTHAGANSGEYALYNKELVMYDPLNDDLYYSQKAY